MPVYIDGKSVEFFCEIKEKQIEVAEHNKVSNQKIDFIYPEVVFPSNKIYKTLGEEKIRELVRKHHEFIKDSPIGHLYPKDEEEFYKATKIIEDFFVEMLGGEKLYTSKKGFPRLRERHFNFEIDEKGREIWLMSFKRAIIETDFPKEHIKELWEWIEPLSIRMINRRRTLEEPKRFFFEDIKKGFGL